MVLIKVSGRQVVENEMLSTTQARSRQPNRVSHDLTLSVSVNRQDSKNKEKIND